MVPNNEKKNRTNIILKPIYPSLYFESSLTKTENTFLVLNHIYRKQDFYIKE